MANNKTKKNASEIPETSTNENNGATNTNEEEADLYLDQYNFTTTAALVASVDRKVMVEVKGGHIFFGILRTYDHFANLTLEFVNERIYLLRDDLENLQNYKPSSNLSANIFNNTVKNYEFYAERQVGCYLLRGENVVFIGEVDIDKEDKPIKNMIRVDWQLASDIIEKKNRLDLRFKEQQKELYAKKGLS
ncbi:hypothetical protein ACO0SA_001695 [Hanseniaspora valbyensis]